MSFRSLLWFLFSVFAPAFVSAFCVDLGGVEKHEGRFERSYKDSPSVIYILLL